MKLAPLKKPLIMLIPLNTAIWLVFGSLFAGVALVISFVTVAVIYVKSTPDARLSETARLTKILAITGSVLAIFAIAYLMLNLPNLSH